jgi:diphosphomevalonate decarboxylase
VEISIVGQLFRPSSSICVKSNANIALVKYWGKRDDNIFLPTRSSLSVTLKNLITTTTASISFSGQDSFSLGTRQSSSVKMDPKAKRFFDIFRKNYNLNIHFDVISKNSFPTTAGIASSASGFSAMATALSKLCGLNLNQRELSILARLGSGSACRSVYDGFVVWNKGELPDGSDSFAKQVLQPNDWQDFRVIVVITNSAQKRIDSRLGMSYLDKSMPNYKKWVSCAEDRVKNMVEAINSKNIDVIGKICEKDCLEMHDCMLHSSPPLTYWAKETEAVVENVKKMRAEGLKCYFTVDAGPNVKIITLKSDVESIISSLTKDLKEFENEFLISSL